MGQEALERARVEGEYMTIADAIDLALAFRTAR